MSKLGTIRETYIIIAIYYNTFNSYANEEMSQVLDQLQNT